MKIFLFLLLHGFHGSSFSKELDIFVFLSFICTPISSLHPQLHSPTWSAPSSSISALLWVITKSSVKGTQLNLTRNSFAEQVQVARVGLEMLAGHKPPQVTAVTPALSPPLGKPSHLYSGLEKHLGKANFSYFPPLWGGSAVKGGTARSFSATLVGAVHHKWVLH